MYVEMYGDETQGEKNLHFPAKVYLRLRHMGRSFFRNANSKTRLFHQPLASLQEFHFDRFGITNETLCNQEKKKGKSKYSFTVSRLSLNCFVIQIQFHF